MLDAAPFQHGFQSVPLPRVDRQPVLHLHRQHAPGEPTLVVLRLPFGRVLGDLLVALQAPGRQRQVIQVAREVAARQPPRRSRRRVLSCQRPPERLNHAQPSAASLKPNHAIGVGPGLGQSFRRRRPPHCAVPQRSCPDSVQLFVLHNIMSLEHNSVDGTACVCQPCAGVVAAAACPVATRRSIDRGLRPAPMREVALVAGDSACT